jgi:hypothetical protein
MTDALRPSRSNRRQWKFRRPSQNRGRRGSTGIRSPVLLTPGWTRSRADSPSTPVLRPEIFEHIVDSAA